MVRGSPLRCAAAVGVTPGRGGCGLGPGSLTYQAVFVVGGSDLVMGQQSATAVMGSLASSWFREVTGMGTRHEGLRTWCTDPSWCPGMAGWLPAMVSFACELGWGTGCQDIWSNSLWGDSVGEINIGTGGLSKVGCSPNVGGPRPVS